MTHLTVQFVNDALNCGWGLWVKRIQRIDLPLRTDTDCYRLWADIRDISCAFRGEAHGRIPWPRALTPTSLVPPFPEAQYCYSVQEIQTWSPRCGRRWWIACWSTAICRPLWRPGSHSFGPPCAGHVPPEHVLCRDVDGYPVLQQVRRKPGYHLAWKCHTRLYRVMKMWSDKNVHTLMHQIVPMGYSDNRQTISWTFYKRIIFKDGQYICDKKSIMKTLLMKHYILMYRFSWHEWCSSVPIGFDDYYTPVRCRWILPTSRVVPLTVWYTSLFPVSEAVSRCSLPYKLCLATNGIYLFQYTLHKILLIYICIYVIFHYLAPGGRCEVLFSPVVCRSVCLSVCVCVCVSGQYFGTCILFLGYYKRYRSEMYTGY